MIEEQGQLTFHAIIAERRGEHDKFRGDVYHRYPEIVCRADTFHQFALAYNHQVACLQLAFLAVVFQPATACQTKGMGQIIAVSIRAQSVKGILYDNIFRFCHILILLFPLQIYYLSDKNGNIGMPYRNSYNEALPP